MFHIREADERGLAAILDIHNEVFATSTAIYRDEPATLLDRRQWWLERVKQEYPVLVATHDRQVLGFASFEDFRPWPGYRYTVELTVHVRADQRGRGIGTMLVRALLDRATSLGKHVMVGSMRRMPRR